MKCIFLNRCRVAFFREARCLIPDKAQKEAYRMTLADGAGLVQEKFLGA
jgi:hypothetical protein